ncbi:hypothetical protein Taro_030106 [Colocasia esculenta]|uniref:Uncharacterized protein n=1 Tax=Colocasia esculenta TaxID=4460 RepID=A0A843VN47_COLES|nr:hypothetical protein [Colocasia esculenta]
MDFHQKPVNATWANEDCDKGRQIATGNSKNKGRSLMDLPLLDFSSSLASSPPPRTPLHELGVATGSRGKVATPMGVVTWALSRRVAPLCLGGRRFKTEGAPHSPPLALSLPLLPPSFPLELPCGFSPVLHARGARAKVVMSRSCRGHGRGAWSEEEVAILT